MGIAERSLGQVREAIRKRGDTVQRNGWFHTMVFTRLGATIQTIRQQPSIRESGMVQTQDREWDRPQLWEGTSGGAESDMLDEILGQVKAAGFVISEI